MKIDEQTDHGAWMAAMKEHVTEQMELCAADRPFDGFADPEDVAHAVALFLDAGDAGRGVPSRDLAALMARALDSLGERHAARRMRLTATGLVRRSRWVFSGADALWVLNLREMMSLTGASIEIALFHDLAAMLDAVAEVWAPADGSGILGLSRISDTAKALLGESHRPTDADGLRREIKQVCALRLRAIAARRNWLRVPVVMDLDLRL